MCFFGLGIRAEANPRLTNAYSYTNLRFNVGIFESQPAEFRGHPLIRLSLSKTTGG